MHSDSDLDIRLDEATAASRVRFDASAFTSVLGMFCASRLLILLVASLSYLIVIKAPLSEHRISLIERFSTWDTDWYLKIVREGYSYVPGDESTVAFYPLYPLLVRAVAWCGLDVQIAGYLVSNVALLGAAVLLWMLAAGETRSRTVANLAVMFLLFCPGAMWFSMIYSESVFLLTLTGCLLAARRRAWLAAAACGYLAALARPPGLLAGIFLALEAWQQWHERRADPTLRWEGWAREARDQWRVVLGVFAPALGHATQLAFYQWRFGDWQAQAKAARYGWGVGGFRTPWRALTENWANVEPFYRWLAYPILGVFLLLAVAGFWSLRRKGFAALALALIALYVSTATIHSLPRYLCTTVPVFLVLGQFAARSRTLELAAFSASVGLLGLLVTLLINGYVII